MFIHELIGKDVVVHANGITYTGKLVEVNENEVYLQSETGWLTIPNTQIEQILLKDTQG